MPIRKLPEAPAAAHILGPAMILVALGVGFGETYLWPRLVIVFGPDIRWLFMVGVIVQTVVMLEMARYAMATGEIDLLRRRARVAADHVVLLRDRDPGLHLAGPHLRRRRGVRGADGHPVAGLGHDRTDRDRGDVHRRDGRLQPGRGHPGLPGRGAGDRVGDRRRVRRQPERPRRHAHRHVRASRRASRTRRSRPRSSRSSSARSRSRARPACSRCGTRCGCATRARAWARTSRRCAA